MSLIGCLSFLLGELADRLFLALVITGSVGLARVISDDTMSAKLVTPTSTKSQGPLPARSRQPSLTRNDNPTRVDNHYATTRNIWFESARLAADASKVIFSPGFGKAKSSTHPAEAIVAWDSRFNKPFCFKPSSAYWSLREHR